ncbi:DUF2007 domain-containing protein [Breznakiella homolactica]|uniref:DUF2007 domain-containing protein n=1 Tax=Breznakiella homolactica TaxID=2798577 RepID=A0A7T7XR39_9SPIR|nr:DUF2007 domain-containing protein [Breznakiella homolactica]QQO10858.1 DUF2007 domain-containing protein [Breznakiella homolactica]
MIKLTIFAVAVILIFALIKRLRDNSPDTGDAAGDDTGEDGKEYGMETRFYEEVRSGKNTAPIARAYSRFDSMFIKSMLQSESIPFHVEYEHMSGLRSGVKIENYNQMVVSVLDEDYDDAILVIEEYISNKKKDPKPSRTRNVFEGVLFGWYVPSPSYSDSVEIIPRKTGG